MDVQLLDYFKIDNVIDSIRECYDSFDKSDNGGPKDQDLIKRIINSGHTSTLEHAVYHFKISGFSRSLLHELSRHRLASPSVRSTRYTLKKMLNSDNNIESFIVLTGNTEVDMLSVSTLRRLKNILQKNPNIKNDIAKYAIPEALRVSERLTINARSLRNLTKLRISPRALWEFRRLAFKLMSVIPDDHKILFDDIDWKNKIE